ncbi:SGNH/GDSL hydrolase family protein [Saccharothrix xinjiangensis]|uniref:SGNH/GDSL hydrolase family protein n=1 Tax=Saccharothrix xinjiangensis TaxID=204798 RepID=A0ABV9Y1B4_9PSEU
MKMIAVALLMSLAPAPAAPEHVALGDSYAAGLGAGGESSNSCRRSSAAHPARWAERNDASFVFAACAGATTADVERQSTRITPATTLVTLTVGGNDAGFADVMTTCTIGEDESCVERVERAEAFVRDELPGRLDALYGLVRERTPEQARVVVLGYPRLFGGGRSLCLMSEPKRDALDRAVDVMSEVIAARAEAAGFTYADVRDEFDGHGVCSGDPWINGLMLLPHDRSYHPSGKGQESGYLPALAEAVAAAGADAEVAAGGRVG